MHLALASQGKIKQMFRAVFMPLFGWFSKLHSCFRVMFCYERGANSTIKGIDPSTSGDIRQDSITKKTMPSIGSGVKAGVTNVVYVKKQNANTVKLAMEAMKFLDKGFRMTPVQDLQEDRKEIAVPISDDFFRLLGNETALKEYAWASLLEGSGKQEMPFSTSQFARLRPRGGR